MKAVFSSLFLLSVSAMGADKPNIIFIMADDLGWKDVAYAGAKFFETPHLDKMRNQGMHFNAAYSGGPNCAPTRGCLMSGTYTPRHHIYQPGGMSKGKVEYMKFLVPAREQKDKALKEKAANAFKITNSLDPAFISLAEVMNPAGYATARLGKWHLGPDLQGFDLSTTNGKGAIGDKYYGNVDVAEDLTNRALKFIDDNKDGPFFLYLSHWDVHTPIRARKAVVDRFKAKLDKIPAAERRNFDPTYAGMIEAVDVSVGRVLAKVDELGLGEKTLIIFTSDNGGRTAVSQLEPLRGEKGSLFEGGTRVPCLMRWTGTIEAGSTCNTPITSVDFLPTFASLGKAELPTTQPVDGVDVSPLFTGKTIPERAIFWHYPMYLQGSGLEVIMSDKKLYSWRGFPSSSMRRGNYKLIEFFETDTIALYDVSKDPGETRQLQQEMPELAAKLHAELNAWQKEVKAPIPDILNPKYIGTITCKH